MPVKFEFECFAYSQASIGMVVSFAGIPPEGRPFSRSSPIAFPSMPSETPSPNRGISGLGGWAKEEVIRGVGNTGDSRDNRLSLGLLRLGVVSYYINPESRDAVWNIGSHQS
eukprot:1374735-Amorphochlora_amoeboformis.AAC.2